MIGQIFTDLEPLPRWLLTKGSWSGGKSLFNHLPLGVVCGFRNIECRACSLSFAPFPAVRGGARDEAQSVVLLYVRAVTHVVRRHLGDLCGSLFAFIHERKLKLCCFNR